MDEIITFDFIWECWKNSSYPENFDNLLERYLETKKELFGNIDMHGQPMAWLNKILIAVEIGVLRDGTRFLKQKEYWKTMLDRNWKVSIEDRWVVWID